MRTPYVVGIAGGSASGKTTLCDDLAERLTEYSVKLFHMDSYFKPEAQRPFSAAPITKKSYMDDNHPDTVDLAALRRDLADAIEEGAAQVIFVEGLLTLWDEALCGRLDLKLFVDCRPDERIVRRLRRNMERGLSFDDISNVYLDMVRYRHDEYVEPSKWRADFILNGSSPSTAARAALVTLIESEVQSRADDMEEGRHS